MINLDHLRVARKREDGIIDFMFSGDGSCDYVFALKHPDYQQALSVFYLLAELGHTNLVELCVGKTAPKPSNFTLNPYRPLDEPSGHK